jgi:hypothetical protein
LKHHASSRFWVLYDALPEDVRLLADKNYVLLKSDPSILHFISNVSVNCGLCELARTIEPWVRKSTMGFCGSGSEPTVSTTKSSANKWFQATPQIAARFEVPSAAFGCSGAPEPRR